MDRHLNTLEFPKILDRLAAHTSFSAGREQALALRPSPFLREVQTRQAETGEAVRLLAEQPGLSIGQVYDVRPFTEQADRGVVLPPESLQKIGLTLLSARDLQRTLTRQAETCPLLADTAGRIDPCPALVAQIQNAIDDRGDIKDNASPALARIRRDIETTRNRLMEKLNHIISSSQYTSYLQEALITQRAGRYVVPVKADFKGRVPGIVHDQSGSGMTLFVEPMATVELNNRLRKLELDEQDEIRRILAELSAAVRQHRRQIDHTVAALADLDLAFAKARYAEALDAVAPEMVDIPRDRNAPPPRFALKAARHPLLDPQTVVPIDIPLPDSVRMLVITGPNTGGKTVSLKTVGLLAAMAQAGLFIPAAEGSTLPVFRRILADIGDEQSIEQSLSTFSAHMTNIVQILKRCDHRSLVILDELGAGTDPVEGSALARAILTWLLERGPLTFVATHYSELKAFAHTTPGVANASMEFNLDTLAPTFHLRLGLPGASNAFAIARRLGLAEEIVRRAQEFVGEESRQMEAMLDEIKTQTAAARDLRRQAEAIRAEAERLVQRQQEKLAEIEAERRHILSSARADARREIKKTRQELKALKARVEAELRAWLEEQKAAAQAAKSAPPPAVEAEIEAELQALADTLPPEPSPAVVDTPPPRRPVRPGDTVFVAQFGALGEVVSVQDNQVEVQLGHFRATVPLEGVELRKKGRKPEPAPAVEVKLPAPESPGMELDLRGQTADEALFNLDRYLDQAFLAQLPWVRVVHGKGSGTLKQAVRQALREHPLVSTFRPGEAGEGGDGVTVVRLATG